MRVQNLHGLALSGFPLGVACTTCGHRALVEAAKVGARDGNMTEIRQLKLRCTECDGTAFEGTIFSAQDQVDDFLAMGVEGRRPAGVLTRAHQLRRNRRRPGNDQWSHVRPGRAWLGSTPLRSLHISRNNYTSFAE